MAKNNSRFSNNINIKNRRAFREYEILEKYEAGIVLSGTEIKSVREGKVNLGEGYCYFDRDELFIKQMHISPYEEARQFNHDPDRSRKLLLHRRELLKLKKKQEEKGLTIIPLRLYINARGLAKVEIAVAKGKKLHDKRESIKEKDVKRDLDRLKIG